VFKACFAERFVLKHCLSFLNSLQTWVAWHRRGLGEAHKSYYFQAKLHWITTTYPVFPVQTCLRCILPKDSSPNIASVFWTRYLHDCRPPLNLLCSCSYVQYTLRLMIITTNGTFLTLSTIDYFFLSGETCLLDQAFKLKHCSWACCWWCGGALDFFLSCNLLAF